MAMGSPISSVIANPVMEDLESTLLPQCPDHSLYKRYVDDILLIAKLVDIPTIRDILQNYHYRLTFSIEIEQNNSLPFLNVLLCCNEDGTLSTEYYKKTYKL